MDDKSTDLWHKRLGHLDNRAIQKLATQLAYGINLSTDQKQHEECMGCLYGKQHRLQFPHESKHRSRELCELIHTDVCGPMHHPSLGGAKYFVTFTDDKSRRTWVYPLRYKGECLTKFKEFKAHAEKQSGRTIKILRSDNGKEFINKEFDNYLALNTRGSLLLSSSVVTNAGVAILSMQSSPSSHARLNQSATTLNFPDT